MILHNLSQRSFKGYTTFGSLWNKGEKKDDKFSLQDEKGKNIPLQSRVQAWWSDGSVKWAAHTADASLMGEKVVLQSMEEKESMEVNIDTDKTDSRSFIQIQEKQDGYMVSTGPLSMFIPSPSSSKNKQMNIAEKIQVKGKELASKIYPIFLLERHQKDSGENANRQIRIKEFRGKVDSVIMEEEGPLQAVFCIRGKHICGEKSHMPYVIRMYLYAGSQEVHLEHSFLFDGDESKDFLKGMGIRIESFLGGQGPNRHISFDADGGIFHEPAVLMSSRIPRLPKDYMEEQMQYQILDYTNEQDACEVAMNVPKWQNFILFQDSDQHFNIQKWTRPECSKVKCQDGSRSDGLMSVGGTNGSISMGIRDFWQKYPSGLEVNSLAEKKTESTMWFYCPQAEAYDFRHYDTRSYPKTNYEGFEEVGASPFGIGVRSECRILFEEEMPTKAMMENFIVDLQNPPVYVADSEYYHEKRAFGYFSLIKRDTPSQTWLEDQLEKAFDFYKKEVEARHWYGLFDYGDVMHSYDSLRHCWKYDVGGFAWQNTELVPTYWLWLYFLRSGREDVYRLVEAMSRHCSEVDIYHFGPNKGIGSRHNVKHWGCSCKEPRVSMAGHHRFLYYLTGDRRLGDIFEEVKDADETMSKNPHSQAMREDGKLVPSARSGPDWSSYVSNWMTWYEKTLDDTYRQKIETGIDDLVNTPYGLASGPDYYYDVATSHLIYHGEIEDTPNQHLQICMGGPQTWWEVADVLEDDRLNQLIENLGAFYFLSPQEKTRRTEGRIVNRPFACPMFATGIAAYSAKRRQDHELALKSWEILLTDLLENGGKAGFESSVYSVTRNKIKLREIPWISTNFVAQWCLNAMMCLEFAEDSLTEAYDKLISKYS